MHNKLQLTPPLSSEPGRFWGRPFKVIHGEVLAGALRDAMEDRRVQQIAQKRLIGSVDQVSDNIDSLEETTRREALLALYL